MGAHAAHLRHSADERLPLQNAALIQMLNGLGLLMTSLRINAGGSAKLAVAPVSLMIGGTCMFSVLIIKEKLTGDRTFSGLIRYGGSATLFGWAALAML